MHASPEQISANRKNAAKSTGPKTRQGKDRSRFNAVKHGMAAKSVLLPGEDEAHVTKRFVNLHAEFKPSTEESEILVDDAAYLSIRLERCRRWDTGTLRKRVRVAEEQFDDARLARVEELAQSLDCRSTTATRRLQAMPEGIDYLLVQWDDLRADLTDPDKPRWSYNHLARTRYLRGIEPSTVRDSREYTLTEVMGGFFANMDPREAEGLVDDAAKVEYARLELLQIFDAEIARLEDARTKLDHGRIAEERAESVDLALFDDSKEAILARKYEAATRRALHKTFKDIREAEAAALASAEDDTNLESEEVSDESGSFEPAAEAGPEPDHPDDEPEAESIGEWACDTQTAPISAEIAPRVAARGPGLAGLAMR